jgi:hypothetical protein
MSKYVLICMYIFKFAYVLYEYVCTYLYRHVYM